MTPLMFNFLEENNPLAEALRHRLAAEQGKLSNRKFPDGETYLQVLSDCKKRSVVVFCNLYQPDEKLLPLIFLTTTLKELGADKIGLVTPYLAYMRQDKRFQPGECISSRPFAKLLSEHFDWLVTVDPHLHRYKSLDEIYNLNSKVVHAAPVIAKWIVENIQRPLLIGPDSESEQWVSQVANLANAPFQVLSKIRHGDYDVEVSLPKVDKWRQHTPVLVDDIISSGKTMLETVEHLYEQKLPKPVCIGVHGLFSDTAYTKLNQQAQIVTCNSVPHTSNAIDLSEELAVSVQQVL